MTSSPFTFNIRTEIHSREKIVDYFNTNYGKLSRISELHSPIESIYYYEIEFIDSHEDTEHDLFDAFNSDELEEGMPLDGGNYCIYKVNKNNYKVKTSEVIWDHENDEYYFKVESIDRDYIIAESELKGFRNSDVIDSYKLFIKNLDEERRYDLMDMIYDPTHYSSEGSGYISYTKSEFTDYYGENAGLCRWNNDLYSSSSSKPIPDIYNFESKKVTCVIFDICLSFACEDNFNISRTLMRYYIDELFKLTDPSDDYIVKKPVILMRANLNTNMYYLSSQGDFKFTNKNKQTTEKIKKQSEKLELNLSYFSNHNCLNMIEYIPG